MESQERGISSKDGQRVMTRGSGMGLDEGNALGGYGGRPLQRFVSSGLGKV